MATYRELIAPPPIRDRVECLWVSEQAGEPGLTRVTPDGCADIVWTRSCSGSSLLFVGPMTRYEDFPQHAGSSTVGIRFRPGMWTDITRTSGEELRDSIIPLSDIWSGGAIALIPQLEDATNLFAVAQLLAMAIPEDIKRSPLQRALKALEVSSGKMDLDCLADETGLSTRQFRRRCIEATGLRPKLLARIVRFRHALRLARSMPGRHAELASECGYADQSHLIAEFREFAGRTPCELIAQSAAA